MRISSLYKYLGKKRSLLASYLIINPISSLFDIMMAYLTGSAVDLAISGNLGQLPNYVLTFSIYALLWYLFLNLHQYIRYSILENTQNAIKDDLMHSLINASPMDFSKENSGVYMAHFSSDMDILRESFFFKILSLYGQAFQFVVALIAMCCLNSVISAFVIVVALVQVAIPIFTQKQVTRYGTVNSQKQQEYTKTCKEILESYETTKLFGVKSQMNDFHKKINHKAEKARKHSKIANMLVYETSFLFGNIMYLGIFLIGAYLVLKGKMTTGSIVAASGLMTLVTYPLMDASENFAEISSANEVADNIQKLINLPPMSSNGIVKHSFDNVMEVKDIHFNYGDKEILKGVSFTFEKGKKYLIKGPSGSGKSTLLALLSNQYVPSSGNIKIDGIDIKDLSEKSLNELMVLNPQEPYLFDWSIADNIRFFNESTDKEIMELIDKSGLNERISRLPDGINANFGENGSEFSGGEKQRIGIIRTILRKTPILLMDESTSHLDVESVKKVEEIFIELKDVTVIIVSHNFSKEFENKADAVISMENGVII